MTYKERKEKLDYLLTLLENGCCHSLLQIAEKLSCSKRIVKRMLAELRSEGHQITYSKQSKMFFIEK